MESPMGRTVTATEARVRFGELMRRVVEHEETVVVEKSGEPKVVVLSVAEYERLRGEPLKPDDWNARLERLHDLVRADLNGRELPDITQLIHVMREERDAQILAAVLGRGYRGAPSDAAE